MSGEIIKDIKSWGYNIALISEFPNEVGVSDADYFVEANTKIPTSALKAACLLHERGISFHGVISLCWDCAVSVALIAEKYGLFGVSMDTAEKTSRKDVRSEAFEKAGVPAPKFRIVTKYDELLRIIDRFQYPVILKPVDLSSSKGVIIVNDENHLEQSFHYARNFSSSPEIIINEYLLGTEHSTEGLMINGELYLTAISDRVFKYKECRPYFVEVGDIMPSILDYEKKSELFDVTRQAALSLGIINGVVKGDLIYCEGMGAFVFEIAARLGGPRFGTEMVPLSNGTNILRAAIQQALREKIDLDLLKPKYAKGMVNRSIFPQPGKILSVQGVEVLNSFPGFYDFKWWGSPLMPGDTIDEYQNTCGNVGYFIATGETRDEALRNADQIESNIQIVTEGT